MIWLQTKDENLLKEAKLNIEKAVQSAENSCHNISPENLIALKENIMNMIHEEANLRENSRNVLTVLTT